MQDRQKPSSKVNGGEEAGLGGGAGMAPRQGITFSLTLAGGPRHGKVKLGIKQLGWRLGAGSEGCVDPVGG